MNNSFKKLRVCGLKIVSAQQSLAIHHVYALATFFIREGNMDFNIKLYIIVFQAPDYLYPANATFAQVSKEAP
jgi:hypothetical protein